MPTQHNASDDASPTAPGAISDILDSVEALIHDVDADSIESLVILTEIRASAKSLRNLVDALHSGALVTADGQENVKACRAWRRAFERLQADIEGRS